MVYNYVVTAASPSSVNFVVTGNFTSPTERNLIIAKSTRVEIHLLNADGVCPLLDVGIYGRISIMQLFRPPTEEKDLLFVVTQKLAFCVLAYDQTSKEIVTRANGDLRDKFGVPADLGQIGIIDPECRMIGLRLYDGMFKVINIDPRGKYQEAFNIRLEDLQVYDIKFLHGYQKPTIAVLSQDAKEQRHVKTFEILLKDKEFGDGPWSLKNVEGGASVLIALPKPLGGALIIGEQTITYHNGVSSFKSVHMKPAIIKTHAMIDQNRYLLGDSNGNLLSLFLICDKNRVTDIKLEKLGTTSILSCLSYLDNGVIFGGSHYGDSQVIRLVSEKDENGSCLRILESFTNLSPVSDFCVVDLDRQGQGQIVTCSGAFEDGSLRVIRNGVGLDEQASIPMEGVKGVWSLRSSEESLYRSILAVSFINETRFLAMTSGDELEETQIPGFEQNSLTLFCGNVVGNQLLQVTVNGVKLVSCATQALVASWEPPSGSRITLASCNGYQLLIAMGGGHLICFMIEAVGNLVAAAETKMEHEIACLDISPLSGETIARVCAVGLWTDITVRLLSVPSLEQVLSQPLGGEIIPRSVILTTFETVPYVLVALGDGSLQSFTYTPGTTSLANQKRIALGTQPIVLSAFSARDNMHIFACSDRPTVIHSSNRKLLFSNVNLREVSHMCPFSSESFTDCLAVVSSNALTIGAIDEIQKLHIRTIPLGEMPRRIAYQESTASFAVATSSASSTSLSNSTSSSSNAMSVDDGGNDPNNQVEIYNIRLLDGHTFEILNSFELAPDENVLSIISCSFSDDSAFYFVVGTAFVLPNEEEPSKGRILVLENAGGKLQLIAEREVKGAVYSLAPFNGKLVAGVNSKVILYKWKLEDGRKELDHQASHHGNILVLQLKTRGDNILVGDLMRSISLLTYNSVRGSLDLLAKDRNPYWTTAIHFLDDDNYLVADSSNNLYTCSRALDPSLTEGQLDVTGEFHYGDFINCFRSGSLVMKLADDNEDQMEPSVLFATSNGVIGVMAQLSDEQYEFLQHVQSNLSEVIKGVGGLQYNAWRAFETERKVSAAKGFIDGDLIEGFLDLPRDKMETVVKNLTRKGKPVSVDYLLKYVEDLARIH